MQVDSGVKFRSVPQELAEDFQIQELAEDFQTGMSAPTGLGFGSAQSIKSAPTGFGFGPVQTGMNATTGSGYGSGMGAPTVSTGFSLASSSSDTGQSTTFGGSAVAHAASASAGFGSCPLFSSERFSFGNMDSVFYSDQTIQPSDGSFGVAQHSNSAISSSQNVRPKLTKMAGFLGTGSITPLKKQLYWETSSYFDKKPRSMSDTNRRYLQSSHLSRGSKASEEVIHEEKKDLHSLVNICGTNMDKSRAITTIYEQMSVAPSSPPAPMPQAPPCPPPTIPQVPLCPPPPMTLPLSDLPPPMTQTQPFPPRPIPHAPPSPQLMTLQLSGLPPPMAQAPPCPPRPRSMSDTYRRYLQSGSRHPSRGSKASKEVIHEEKKDVHSLVNICGTNMDKSRATTTIYEQISVALSSPPAPMPQAPPCPPPTVPQVPLCPPPPVTLPLSYHYMTQTQPFPPRPIPQAPPCPPRPMSRQLSSLPPHMAQVPPSPPLTMTLLTCSSPPPMAKAQPCPPPPKPQAPPCPPPPIPQAPPCPPPPMTLPPCGSPPPMTLPLQPVIPRLSRSARCHYQAAEVCLKTYALLDSYDDDDDDGDSDDTIDNDDDNNDDDDDDENCNFYINKKQKLDYMDLYTHPYSSKYY